MVNKSKLKHLIKKIYFNKYKTAIIIDSRVIRIFIFLNLVNNFKLSYYKKIYLYKVIIINRILINYSLLEDYRIYNSN